MSVSITTIGKSTVPDSNPIGYLLVNPDVQRAGADPVSHKRTFGISEGRQEFLESSLQAIEDVRNSYKSIFLLEVLRPISVVLRESLFANFRTQKYFALDESLPVKQDEVGLNSYDNDLDLYLENHPKEWWLDMGAGLRDKYRSNVIYTEISDLPTTDVICFGENLPFKENSFDGVVCLAVLEHVVNPQIVFDELVRVTKPGGSIIIDWPFLQPYHGHPFHFYNATSQGVLQLARNNPATIKAEISVPDWLHPVHSLQWILRDWAGDLSENARVDFLEQTVGQLLSTSPYELIANNSFGQISEKVKSVIAAGHRVTFTKGE